MGPRARGDYQSRNQRNLRAEQEQKMPSESNPGWEPGHCSPGICGLEAACRNFSNGTHICVCPHDSSQPTKDLRCPMRIIVPSPPRPIHNIIPPITTNLTILNSSLTTPSSTPPRVVLNGTQTRAESSWMMGMGVLGTAASASVLLLAFVFICWWHKRHSATCFNKPHKDKDGAPMSLRKSLLEQERYIANPQYTPCTLQSVPTLPRESLVFLHAIGEGCFGKVYKGELRVQDLGVQIVAIKALKEAATREAEDDFMREVEIMSTFRHANILSLIGVVPRDGTKNPWMVFEFMPHGDLMDVLRSNSRHLSKAPSSSSLPRLTKESQILIAVQIASGMCYLAAQRFVHRDLACRNCLVGENLVVKIADFGMSRDVYTCDYYKMGGSRLLPVRWMSPESVVYGRFTLESDVWSYGVVLWEIFTLGKQPYYGHCNEEVIKIILQGTRLIPPEDCPTQIADLMRACWKTEAKDRIQFSDIYEKLTAISSDQKNQTTLPRPPAFLVGLGTTATMPTPTPIPHEEVLDSDNYLQPQGGTREYLQPLPD